MHTHRTVQRSEVELMREGAFAGLPESVRLVHLSDRPAPRGTVRQRPPGEATLSGALIKRRVR